MELLATEESFCHTLAVAKPQRGKKGDTHINSLPDLQHPPGLRHPVAAQHARPALKGVHLAGGALQIALLEHDLRARESGLDVVAVGEAALALLGEHHAAEDRAGGVRSDARIFGEQRGFAHFRGDAAEAVDQVGRAGDAALVGGGVDGGDGCGDDFVALADFFQGDELVDEGRRVLGVQDSVAHGLERDVKVLGGEVGVDDLAPVAGELLELRHGGGQVVQLGETAVALLLNLGLDGAGEVLLQADLLLKESVLVLLLGNAACGVELGGEALVVRGAQPFALGLVLITPPALGLAHLLLQTTDKLLGGLIELGVGILNLSLSFVRGGLLKRGNSANNLLEVRLGTGHGGAELAGFGAGVDGGDNVVDHLHELLDDRLGGLLDVDMVNAIKSGLGRSSVLLLRALDSLDVLLLGGLLGHTLSDLGLRLVLRLSAHVTSLGPEITLLRSLRGQTAALADGDLILSAHLRPVLVLNRARGEAPAELALLEVGHGIFAAGDVLGEEVVEVVAVERVVDTASVAESREDDQSQEETAETTLGFGPSGRACGSGAVAGGRQVSVRRRGRLYGSGSGSTGGGGGGGCLGRSRRSPRKTGSWDVGGRGLGRRDGILRHAGGLVAGGAGENSLVRRSRVGQCALERWC